MCYDEQINNTQSLTQTTTSLPFPPGGFEGLFHNSAVTEIDGKEAYSSLMHVDPKKDAPDFVMFYHPKCPACEKAIGDFKQLGQYVKEHNSKIKIIAVNSSKSHDEVRQMGVRGYPTFALIKDSKELPYTAAKYPRTLEGFNAFLYEHGINL